MTPQNSNEPTNQPTEHIMQFFAYEHLPPGLQAVSKSFCDLARIIVAEGEMPTGTAVQFPLPRSPERPEALRKLLKAKDAAVRGLSLVYDDPRTRADYLQWAPILLACEDWHHTQREKRARS